MNKLVVAALLFLTALNSLAQTTTGSPYSFYGIGDPNSNSFSNYKAMGEAQVALADPFLLNLKNSAAFASLEQPTFAVDVHADFLQVSTPTTTQSVSSQYINGVAFGFPMGKRFGAAFSMGPYTRIGYDITAPQSSDALGDFEFTYTGEGGYNRATGGIGGMPWLDEKNKLMLGVQAHYYFGFSQTSRSVSNFVDNANVTSSKLINRTNINDVGIDFGILYQRKIGKEAWVSGAVNYKPSSNINANNQQLSYTYRPVGLSDNIIDTVQDISEEGNLTLPSEFSAGIAFYLSNSWILSAEYSTTSWSELALIDVPFSMSDGNALSGGVQFVADPDPVATFFQSIRYRAGVRYENTRLNFNGEQLSQIAGTAGIGIPLQKTKMKSTFNFGIEIGSRGQEGNAIVKENFTNLFIGLSMNPHKFDGWFKRSKYN